MKVLFYFACVESKMNIVQLQLEKRVERRQLKRLIILMIINDFAICVQRDIRNERSTIVNRYISLKYLTYREALISYI